MPQTYSTQIVEQLRQRFSDANLYRPMRVCRYETGTELTFEITSVETSDKAQVTVTVESFVGGGYAGQVYKVKVTEIDDDARSQLHVGNTYAMKILIPPSGFGRIFRNMLYWIGFGGPFQQQVNPTAARAGALWQKFIRRAAGIRFGDEGVVNNVHAIFVDRTLGSCGEISDWIDGRTWRLEVDDHMDLLRLQAKGHPVDESKLCSEEYRAKKKFMADFVALLHDLGAYEFARQYEWSTCKSQPNALKLKNTESDPNAGLVAVDFRAGLTLLPFLPMSPGDFKLIGQGIKRGSIVQFDRGDVEKLQSFVEANSEPFIDMVYMLDELKSAEKIYRNSIPDITHNRIRLLHDAQLWLTIFDSAVTGWRTRNIIDESREREFRHNRFHTLIFCLVGFIPFLGKLIRRLWVSPDWQKHYASLIKDFEYLGRAVKGLICEKMIAWHRAGRISEQNVMKLVDNPWQFFAHLPLSILPAGLHRFLTDKQFFKDKLHYIFVRPINLYFSSSLREQWLKDMVEEGKKKHILTDEDASTILSQLNEPYIQRYLVSLVVHLMTLPLTQIVSVIVAWIYYHRTGDELGAGGILVLFQIIPISPGSLARGLYAVGIAVYDRSFKDYNIAVFLSFFKYIGYLAFPIQMTYRYPALARFMASHFATEIVHTVPVFGERGALLEHWVFCLFYNWPLTIRRRMASRAEIRTSQPPQYRHIPLCALATALVFAFADWMWLNQTGSVPTVWKIWYATFILPALCGSVVTLYAGGAQLWKRFVYAAAAGLSAGVFYTMVTAAIVGLSASGAVTPATWPFRLFFFAVFACIGAIITELRLPDPQVKSSRTTANNSNT
jgi:hypothetical protein